MDTESTNNTENLSRFLDGDLSGNDAMEIIGQVSQNTSLQQNLDELRQVKNAMRRTALLPNKDSETMRLRVASRFRANVESQSWTPTGKTSSVSRSLFAHWRPAFVTLVAAATVVGIYFLVPFPTVTNIPIDNANAVSAPLPDSAEMSLLFDLHDAHGVPLSSENTTLNRHHTAGAQAALLERADSLVVNSL